MDAPHDLRLHALIVDDEAPAREELAWLISQASERRVQIVGQCASSREVITWLDAEAHPLDLIFLDVDMPGVDGVRLAELLHKREQRPAIVFVTAYEEYAVDAFEVDAVDYLLKPVRMERLERALKKVVERHLDRLARQASQQSEPLTGPVSGARFLDRISVEDHGVYRVVPIDDILFFESEDGIVVVQTKRERFITDFSLKFLEQNLNPEHFFRSHRSYIVKLDRIDSIAPWGAGTYRLVMDRDSDLGVPLARSRASELKSLIPWSASVFEE